MSKEQLQQLQMMEQHLQQFSMQKQQYEGELKETQNAVSELKKTEESFKIIGNVLVKVSKDDLLKELEEKHVLLTKRIETLSSQEEKLRSNMTSLQEELMEQTKDE